jgi:hypothetical protein
MTLLSSMMISFLPTEFSGTLGYLNERRPDFLFEEFFDEGVDEDEELDNVEFDHESSIFEYSHV